METEVSLARISVMESCLSYSPFLNTMRFDKMPASIAPTSGPRIRSGRPSKPSIKFGSTVKATTCWTAVYPIATAGFSETICCFPP